MWFLWGVECTPSCWQTHCPALRPVLRAGTERPILCWKWQWHCGAIETQKPEIGEPTLNYKSTVDSQLDFPGKTVKRVSVPWWPSFVPKQGGSTADSLAYFGNGEVWAVPRGSKGIKRTWRYMEIWLQGDLMTTHEWICKSIEEYCQILWRTRLVILHGLNHASTTKWRQKHLLGREKYV